ncbi:hypothetical protein [Microvirga ossetica]|uniref:hypothetical protein n=1 Tax=Microvirga ossetica TaxID=1882682 RepID=UPI0013000912|nr:hypothetical protein [Microvirga ossetica]
MSGVHLQRYWIWAAVGSAISLALWPLTLVTYPPLQDLPNHLARIAVLNASENHPILEYYSSNWNVLPNLASDVMLLTVSFVFSPAVSSKLFVAIAVILWIISPFFLHYALYRRHSPVAILGSITVLNSAFHKGFLNFFLGSGLVVILFSIWILMSHKSTLSRIIAGIAMSFALFFCHLFVFAIFAICVFLWEALDTTNFHASSRKIIIQKACLLLPTLALPALAFLLFSPTAGASGWDAQKGLWDDGIYQALLFKFQHVRTLFTLGWPGILASLAVVSTTLGLAFYQAFPGMLWRMVAINATLLAFFFLLPPKFMSGANVDWRMLGPLSLFVAGSARLPKSPYIAATLVPVVLLILGPQSWYVANLWRKSEQIYLNFSEILASIPRGSRLFYSTVGMPYSDVIGPPSILHLGSLAVIERSAIVPSLFAYPTQQPIRVKPNYSRRHQAVANPFARTLRDIDWGTVQKDFDFVVLASSSRPENTTEFDWLQEIETTGTFHLYRVVATSGLASP